MKVIWTQQAELDRLTIFEFISTDNPDASMGMDLLFSRTAARLRRFPQIGRPGVVDDTREYVVHPSYRLIYAILNDEVWVLSVLHNSRQWPPLKS